MGNRAEELRKQIIAGGGPTATHSMNQKTTGYIIQMQERGFDRKAASAGRRKEKREQFSRQSQFDRALGNTFNRRSLEDIIDLAPENIEYVVKHIDGYEQVMGRFRIRRSNGNGEERITEVTTTIVDFTRPNSNSLR